MVISATSPPVLVGDEAQQAWIDAVHYYQLVHPVAGERVLDLGAHVGAFSRLCLDVGARVTAVEPHPDNFRALLANASKAEALEAAVATRGGTGSLYVHRRSMGHSRARHYSSKKIPVKLIAFSAILQRVRPHVIKCDIEGYEHMLQWQLVPDCTRAVAMEIHVDCAAELRSYGTIVKVFAEKGFRTVNRLPPEDAADWRVGVSDAAMCAWER